MWKWFFYQNFKEWIRTLFSPWDNSAPGERLAMSGDILGRHSRRGVGDCWHLADAGQRCCWTSYSTQDSSSRQRMILTWPQCQLCRGWGESLVKETLNIMFLAMLQTNTKNLSPENTSGKSEVERASRGTSEEESRGWGLTDLQVRELHSHFWFSQLAQLGVHEILLLVNKSFQS